MKNFYLTLETVWLIIAIYSLIAGTGQVVMLLCIVMSALCSIRQKLEDIYLKLK